MRIKFSQAVLAAIRDAAMRRSKIACFIWVRADFEVTFGSLTGVALCGGAIVVGLTLNDMVNSFWYGFIYKGNGIEVFLISFF